MSSFGTYGSGDGEFDYPSSIGIDSLGNIYVADVNLNRVQKFDSSGNYLTQWGTNGSGDGEFNYPFGLAIDTSDNIYISDTYNHRVQKFDSNGNYLSQWGVNGGGNGEFDAPMGITTDSAGNIYVADTSNNRIQKFDNNGNYLTQWGEFGYGDSQMNSPELITYNPVNDTIFVLDSSNYRIQQFDTSGTLMTDWGYLGGGDGEFQYGEAMGINSLGNLYVGDSANYRIQKFTFGTPPDAITDLAATPSDSAVNLTWTAPNDNGSPITNYRIRYGLNTGLDNCDPTTPPYTNCFLTLSATTNKTVTGLNNDSEYIFAVYAINSGGSGPASNTVTSTPSETANCPGLTANESCIYTTIQTGGLSFNNLPDNTVFTSAQNNTSLPSYNNASGTDAQDVLSVTDLRNDPAGTFEVQLSASAFQTGDQINAIPLDYLYVASSLPRVSGAIDDETEGIEYAQGCSGSTNNITNSVNLQNL